MDSLDCLAGVRVISIVAAGNRLNYHNFRMPDKYCVVLNITWLLMLMESCLAGGGMNMAHVGMGPNRMSCCHVTSHHCRIVVAPPTV